MCLNERVQVVESTIRRTSATTEMQTRCAKIIQLSGRFAVWKTFATTFRLEIPELRIGRQEKGTNAQIILEIMLGL